MNVNDFFNIDLPGNSIEIKKFKNENSSVVIKINTQEIKEIKLKKDAILFFTTNSNYENPIKPEVTFNIYLLENHNLEIIIENEDKKELKAIENFIKSSLL